MTQKKADLLILFVTFCWGSSYLFMKEGLDSVGPYMLILLRFGIAFLAAGAFAALRHLLRISRTALIDSAILGLLLFLGFAALTTGLGSTTTSNAGFLVSLLVVFIPLMEALFFHKHIGSNTLCSVLLAITGIGFLTLHGSFQLNAGDALCLLSAFFNALQVLYISHALKQSDAITIGVLQLGFAALLGGIVSLCTEVPALPDSGMGWFAILYLGLICSAFGFIAQIIGQKYTSAERVGILFCFEPVFASVLGVLLLHEPFGLASLLGASLILGSVFVSGIKSDPPQEAPADS